MDEARPPAPLRIGLLVESLRQPAWACRAVREACADGVATLAVVIVAPRAARGEPAPWLYRVYRRLDARKFGERPDPLAPTDLGAVIGEVPRVTVALPPTPEDVERVLAHRLDVVLAFTDRRLAAAIAGVARHGAWRWRLEDDERYPGGPAGFWEVMRRDPVTGVSLEAIGGEGEPGRALYRSWSSTHNLSVQVNLHYALWKASTFAARALRTLRDDGPTALAAADAAPAAYGGRAWGVPRTGEMAGLIARLAARYVAAAVRVRVESRGWGLAYRPGAPAAGDKELVPDLVPHRFEPLVPPPGHVWADPFPVAADGCHHVFVEVVPPTTRRGHIAVLTIEPDGRVSRPVPVIERPYHLSYPFVFEWDGAWWMIPESSENETVDLYRAERFPDVWRHERTLIAGRRLVDATLAEIDGRWWMFANAPALPDVRYEAWLWDELHLFHAPSPLGPWTPHRRNPVVSDVRRARPAGRLFTRDGAWYRPAQDSSGGYGAGLSIQRIVRLDLDAYEEAPVTTLAPRWQPRLSGLHTVNAAPGLTVIDVQARRWRNPFTARRHTAEVS